MENGNKTIRSLQDRDRQFKYFCPKCRETRQLKASNGKRPRGFGRASYLGKTTSFLRQDPPKKSSTRSVAHSRQQDDETDDIIEEITKKIKVNEPIAAFVDQNILKEGTTTTVAPPLDIAKKKLDSMFNRHQNQKKKFQTRVITTFSNVEFYSDIDKLMTVYGGNLLIDY